MEFRVCSVQVTMYSPLTLKNAMVTLSHFSYVTALAADTEISLLNVIMRCVTILSTLHKDPSTLDLYLVIP